MPTTPFYLQQFMFLDNSPAAGGKLYTFLQGTETPTAVYLDAGLTTTAPNPITLGADGVVPQFFVVAHVGYAFRLTDPRNGVETTVWTRDYVETGDSGVIDVGVTSVGVSAPALMSSAGGPVIDAGVIALEWAGSPTDIVLADGSTAAKSDFATASDYLHITGGTLRIDSPGFGYIRFPTSNPGACGIYFDSADGAATLIHRNQVYFNQVAGVRGGGGIIANATGASLLAKSADNNYGIEASANNGAAAIYITGKDSGSYPVKLGATPGTNAGEIQIKAGSTTTFHHSALEDSTMVGKLKCRELYVNEIKRLAQDGSAYLTAISVSGLSNGFIPVVSTAGGLLANSSLSEGTNSVNSAKPITLGDAVNPGHSATMGLVQLSTANSVGADDDGHYVQGNAYYSGGWRAIEATDGSENPVRVIEIDKNGAIKYRSDLTVRAAGAVASLVQRWGFSKQGGLGVFGATPPTSRPTISGQRTATATLAALYQALGLTGIILDATTGTSVTREASVTLLALTANAPSDVTIAGGVRAYGFPGTGTMKELFFAVDFQHDYIAGGDIIAHGHWLPATGAGGNVKWQAESMWVEAGGVWDTTALSSSTVAAGTVAKADKRFDITLSGTGHTYNSRLVIRIFRDSADAADTYAGDAILPVFGVHYQADPGQP